MTNRLRKALFLLAAGVLLTAVIGVLARQRGPVAPATAGVVTRVYDGDTVDVSRAGRVRLLGIDALDAYNEQRRASQARHYGMPERRVRYWAKRAEEFARERLLHQNVVLKYGYETFDVYNRRLAYVHLPGETDDTSVDFDLLMIQEGLAAAYRRFEHPRRADYIEAEQHARAQGKGFWQDVASRGAD